jgi:hypothetical protein
MVHAVSKLRRNTQFVVVLYIIYVIYLSSNLSKFYSHGHIGNVNTVYHIFLLLSNRINLFSFCIPHITLTSGQVYRV